MLAATASLSEGPPWDGERKSSNDSSSSGSIDGNAAAESMGGHRPCQPSGAAGAVLFVSGSHPVRSLPGVSR